MLRKRVRPRLLVVEHEPAAGLGLFVEPLREQGVDLDVRRPYAGDALPSDLGDAGGLLVLGGAVAAWEDDRCAWLPTTRDLLRQGAERGIPTLGICLGAQLLALALGGRVEPGAAGPELGTPQIRLRPEAADDPLLRGLGPSRPAPSGHHDEITQLPPGGVHLADSARYPHQAFRVGAAAWGVQFHPEVTVDDFGTWMATEAPPAPGGDDPAAALAAYADSADEVRAAWRPLAERFGALVAATAAVPAR